MKRRTFIQASSVALLGSAFSLRAQTPMHKSFLKKAVNLGMAKIPGTTGDVFLAIRDAGFEGVEINRPGAIEVAELIRAREASGLKIAGVVCSTHWSKPLTHNDPAIRAQGLEGLKRALQDAGELGCEKLLLVPGVVNKDTSYADVYERAKEAIATAIPWAKEAGCKICVENVWNNFLLSPLEASRFIDEIQSPWVGWHFDAGNIVNYGWPEQWIAALGPRLFNLHIKEFSRKKRDAEGLWKGFGVELGEGDVDWPAVTAGLQKIGYSGFAIAEVPGGDLSRLKFLAERMDRILTAAG